MKQHRGRRHFYALGALLLSPLGTLAGKDPAATKGRGFTERREWLRVPKTRACYTFPGKPECLATLRQQFRHLFD